MSTLPSEQPALSGIDLLLAEREIRSVLVRYTRGNDRNDWDAIRACYHVDATDKHLGVDGDIDQFIAYVKRRHAGMVHSVHHLGNVAIEFIDAHNGIVESYVIAIQRTREGEALTDFMTCCRYLDKFERRNGGPWLIAKRIVSYGLSRFDKVGTTLEDVAEHRERWTEAKMGPDDAVYTVLGSYRFSGDSPAFPPQSTVEAS